MADVDIDGQKGIALASETCAFNQFEVSSISEISPGGLVILKSGKWYSTMPLKRTKSCFVPLKPCTLAGRIHFIVKEVLL